MIGLIRSGVSIAVMVNYLSAMVDGKGGTEVAVLFGISCAWVIAESFYQIFRRDKKIFQ